MQQDDAAQKAKAADEDESVGRWVIVDLGAKSRKAIKKLKRGTGNAAARVDEAIHKVRSHLPEADKDKPFIPVLVVYKRKRRRAGLPSLPFSPLNLFR
jgi:hypothetical protein